MLTSSLAAKMAPVIKVRGTDSCFIKKAGCSVNNSQSTTSINYVVYVTLCANKHPCHLRGRLSIQRLQQWKMHRMRHDDNERNKKRSSPRRRGFHKGGDGTRDREGEEIARASSVPLSVGAQILLHYLSSSADNTYSPSYVRSVFSLTSALMLLSMAHSRVRTGVDTCCCTVSSHPSLFLFCLSPLLRVHSITSTSRPSFMYKAATQALSPFSSGLAFESLQTGGEVAAVTFRAADPAVRQKLHTACSRWQMSSLMPRVITETRKAKRSTLAMGKSSFLCTRCLLSDFFFFFFLHKYIVFWPPVKPENGSFFGQLQDNLPATGQITMACTTQWNIITSVRIDK